MEVILIDFFFFFLSCDFSFHFFLINGNAPKKLGVNREKKRFGNVWSKCKLSYY